MIPNIFHFINVGPREFSLMHFLSIYTAYKLNNPDKIYVYVDHEQKDNIYWDILKDIVEYEFVEAPTIHKGVPIESFQYKADIIRMEKLIERGGIYMDLDVLSLKPLTDLRNHNIVLGSEASDDPNSTNLEDFKSITNAVLMTEPNNDFIKFWYDQIGDNLIGKPWAYHAVCLPKKLLQENSFDVHLDPSKTFLPFCFRHPYIWNSNMNHRINEFDESYTIHLWETIWWQQYTSKLDVEYLVSNNNIISKLFNQYLDIINENQDKIKTIITNCMENGDMKKLLYYTNMLNSLQKLKVIN